MVSGLFGSSLLISELVCILNVALASLVSAVLILPLPPVVSISIVVCVAKLLCYRLPARHYRAIVVQSCLQHHCVRILLGLEVFLLGSLPVFALAALSVSISSKSLHHLATPCLSDFF
jgi:hypothetical protein